MELGTFFYNNKLYNLNFMNIDELKKIVDSKIVQKDYAMLRRVYEYRLSDYTVNSKIQNQLNAINIEINQVNNKFIASTKNYNLIKDEIDNIENEYTKILKRISYKYDEKIERYILKLLKNENKLFKNKKLDVEKIKEIKSENKVFKSKIIELSDEKVKKILNAMESDEKRISTKIIKPKNFGKITRFFANKFNTYNVITKNILNPICQRIEEYLSKNISIYDIEVSEFDIEKFEIKVDKIMKPK